MTIRIIHGDCRTELRKLRDESVQCCVTSPPYLGLRDYQVDGQIGLEKSPDEYVAQMVAVFREVRRVLRSDGVAFLNLGDSTRNKQLLGIPWRVAFALQAEGWWLRSAIVWAKPNPMPESVSDRPTSSYEMVFLLAKSERYFWDADAVREEETSRPQNWTKRAFGKAGGLDRNENPERFKSMSVQEVGSAGRNLRNVWTIATKPFSGNFLDFANADYVDGRGTPRKLSPDCPVHGRRGQPPPGTGEAAFCGEQQGYPDIRTSTDDGLVLKQPYAASATEDYRGQMSSDNRPTSTQCDTGANKIPASWLGAGGSAPPSRNEGIQSKAAPPKTGSFPREDFATATANSTQTRRMGRDPESFSHDMSSEELASNTLRTALRPAEMLLCERMGESKTEALPPSSHETENAPSLQGRRTSRTRYGKSSEQSKCCCEVSQGSHFATMPPDLAERCIKAGSRPGDTILDPFGGAGTTGLVADRLGRNAILIELNPAYRDMASARVTADCPLFTEVA